MYLLVLVTCVVNQYLGIQPEQIELLQKESQKKSITLRLSVQEKCKFVKKETRVEEGKSATVVSNLLGSKTKIYSENTIHEWLWEVSIDYRLCFYVGSLEQPTVSVLERVGQSIIKTTTDHPPRAEVLNRDHLEVDLTPLFAQFGTNSSKKLTFSINRQDKDCYTPSRNNDTKKV
jgi:hypothetical protein